GSAGVADALKDLREQVRPADPVCRIGSGWCLRAFPYVAKELGMKKQFLTIALLAATAAYAHQTAQPSKQQPGAQAKPGQPQTTQPGQQQPGMQQQQPGQTGQQPGQPGMQQQTGQPGTQQPGMQQPGQQAPGQQTPGQQQPGQQPGQAPAAPPEVQQVQIQVPQPQKAPEIKDPAEYQAYVAAIQQGNPQAKITALEGFLQ